MSLSFCHDIQLIGSEFGVNNMKAWILPCITVQARDCVEDILLPLFGPVSTN